MKACGKISINRKAEDVMSTERNKESSINWGGLAKGILAGAAVVAGVVLVAPGLLGGLVEGVQNIGTSLAGTADTEPNAAAQTLGWLVKKAAGIALAVTGASYLLSGGSGGNEAEHASRHQEARESFALREDMRKMQAVMMARMQAAGQDPAAGMAR